MGGPNTDAEPLIWATAEVMINKALSKNLFLNLEVLKNLSVVT